jgi:hypothetical protein
MSSLILALFIDAIKESSSPTFSVLIVMDSFFKLTDTPNGMDGTP